MHDIGGVAQDRRSGGLQPGRADPAGSPGQPHGPQDVVEHAVARLRGVDADVVAGLLLAQRQVVDLHLDATETREEDIGYVSDPHPTPPADAVAAEGIRRWLANQPMAQAPPTGISARKVKER